MEACRPYLDRQIALLAPRVILVLGRIAAHYLLETTEPISRLRGQVFQRGGIDIFPTFHPAYLLRNQADKKLVHADLLQMKARLAAVTIASLMALSGCAAPRSHGPGGTTRLNIFFTSDTAGYLEPCG